MSPVHRDRARAESFGTVAALYDRHRPRYPEALIDDLAALTPARAVDVGCGTGQAARALARRGVSVLGVEPDARMAALARDHGVAVEVATFEDWDHAGRRFDLLTFGASWHWIDPERGIAKAARVLRPGGTLARFWSAEVPDERAVAALESVYRRLAPHATRYVPAVSGDWDDPVTASGAFGAIEDRRYPWSRTLDAEAWIGMVTTFSDHQRLEPDRLLALQQALAEAIAGVGGAIEVDCVTYARLARRA
ncbi:MAG TPA: class I SAM-dependent methyltransferase [Polyangia bacterium]|nr:class I SAM-dependent methyltransferase [Polyangia bacterium]